MSIRPVIQASPVRGRKHSRTLRRRHARRRVLMEALEDRRLLATLTVNSALDNLTGGDGLVTLREAIIAANGDSTTDLAQTGSGADTIVFDPSLNGTPIMLTITGTAENASASGDLDITTEVTIQGNGVTNTVIDAGGVGGLDERVLHVLTGGNLTLDSLTVSGGNATGLNPNHHGGGLSIESGAEATVSGSTISGNTASYSGGGLMNRGTATISGSTVSGNTASHSGGGLYNRYGTATISNSTVSGNSAIGDGDGGGIHNYGGATTVTNSTITGNMANRNGGGIHNDLSTLTVISSTITGNTGDADGNNNATGGGLWTFNDGMTFSTLINTIVAGNLQGTGTTPSDIANKNVEAGSLNNLIGDPASAGGLIEGTAGNRVGDGSGNLLPLNQIVGPLADNGGPTLTRALVLGGRAFDAGSNANATDDGTPTGTPLMYDQRGVGFDRILFGTVDIGAFEAPEAPSLVVTTELDVVNQEDHLTSLREAVLLANSNADASVITFDPSLNGTPIMLTITGTAEDASASGDLDITTEVTIQGNGVTNTVIDAGGVGGLDERVLHVLTGGNLTLDSLTVSGGNATGSFPNHRGGGLLIESGAEATVTGSTVSGNTASDDGGGLMNRGTATISRSTVSGNTASDDGGGLINYGTATINGSTVSGNTASSDGGGLFNGTGGAATVISSTITGNMASRHGGGIHNNDNAVTVISSTITGNTSDADGNTIGTGGGLWTFNDGVTFSTLFNTIVAGNLQGTGTTPSDIANKNVEAGSLNNLIGDPGSAGGLVEGTAGNRLGDGNGNLLPLNQIVGPLADNGGPTLTRALVAGGRAIDAGSNANATDDGTPTGTPLMYDQRGVGFDRILFGTVDIGAFEAPEPPSLVVTTELDVVNHLDGLTSLREAVLFANSNADASVITFDPSLNGTPIMLAITGASEDASVSGDLDITTEVTIQGNGVTNTVIDAGGVGGLDERVLHVLTGGNLTLDSLTVSGGNATGSFPNHRGGGLLIESGAEATVTGSTVSGNTASDDGGGLYNFGTATISGSTISSNMASDNGGGLYSRGTATISGSTVSGNTAGLGGGLYNGSTATISGSTVSGNTAGFNGGGLFNGTGGAATVTSSTITGNMASRHGGGIHNNDNAVTVISSTITGNTSDADGNTIGTGGGLWTYNDGATFSTLINTIVAGNIQGTGTTPSDIANKNVEAGSLNNLIGDPASAGGLVEGTAGNRLGDGSGNLLPLGQIVGPLADNGGPTLTRALVPGGRAIDAGSNANATDDGTPTGTPLTSDQRGAPFLRNVGAGADIGAFELQTIDFGDAPGPYPTTIAEMGASHQSIGPRLGNTRDGEINGQPSALADGDGSDEDGVMFGSIGLNASIAAVNIDLQNAAAAKVDAWIDFNGNQVWEASEQILTSADVVSGLQTMNFTVPATAVAGNTFARVRVSMLGGLAMTGAASDGEVEDYQVTIYPEVPQVETVTINGGAATRSKVTSLSVTFDSEVDHAALQTAFSVTNITTSTAVGMVHVAPTNSGGKTTAVLTFSGASTLPPTNGTLGTTLLDGNYRLDILASQVKLASNNAAMMPIDYVFGGQLKADANNDNFFRHYGDADGDGNTDFLDFSGGFLPAFGNGVGSNDYREDLDFDGDGNVDFLDFSDGFLPNFGTGRP